MIGQKDWRNEWTHERKKEGIDKVTTENSNQSIISGRILKYSISYLSLSLGLRCWWKKMYFPGFLVVFQIVCSRASVLRFRACKRCMLTLYYYGRSIRFFAYKLSRDCSLQTSYCFNSKYWINSYCNDDLCYKHYLYKSHNLLSASKITFNWMLYAHLAHGLSVVCTLIDTLTHCRHRNSSGPTSAARYKRPRVPMWTRRY